jgi:hypothetical protein
MILSIMTMANLTTYMACLTGTYPNYRFPSYIIVFKSYVIDST